MNQEKLLNALASLSLVIAAGLSLMGPDGTGLIGWLIAAFFVCMVAINKNTRMGTLLTALSALSANGYLLRRKFAASGDAICNISATFNCDAVNNSAASEMFGLPITLFGVAFYAGLIFAALASSAKSPRFHQANAIFALFNVIVSIWLGAITVQLGVGCVMCISIYASNGLLLWAGLKGLKDQGTAFGTDLGSLVKSSTVLRIIVIFFAVTTVGSAVWNGKVNTIPTEPGSQIQPRDLGRLYNSMDGPIVLDGSEYSKGPADATYHIIEFADYACPHCAQADVIFNELVKHRDDVRITFKPFPLTSPCNPGIDQDGGPQRCDAAFGSECAGQQGQFFEYSSRVFAHQRFLNVDDLQFHAEEMGLDIQRWKICLTDPATRAGVIKDAEAGLQAGVHGTPAVFMKGTHGDDFISVRGAESVIKLIEAHEAGVTLPAPTPHH